MNPVLACTLFNRRCQLNNKFYRKWDITFNKNTVFIKIFTECVGSNSIIIRNQKDNYP